MQKCKIKFTSDPPRLLIDGVGVSNYVTGMSFEGTPDRTYVSVSFLADVEIDADAELILLPTEQNPTTEGETECPHE